MPPPAAHASTVNPPSQLTSEATYGFLTGASRFLAVSIPTHLALTYVHPVYRNLTVQFKVFLQLSAGTLGGYIWAEKRVAEYNEMLRRRHRALERSRSAWNEEKEVRDRVRAMMLAEEGEDGGGG